MRASAASESRRGGRAEGRRSASAATARSPVRRRGRGARGPLLGGGAAASYRGRSKCRPTRSSSPSSSRAQRTGSSLTKIAVLAEEVDDPDARRGEHQAAVELRDVGLDDPDPAGRRPADQDQVAGPSARPTGRSPGPAAPRSRPGSAGPRGRPARAGHSGRTANGPIWIARPALEPARTARSRPPRGSRSGSRGRRSSTGPRSAGGRRAGGSPASGRAARSDSGRRPITRNGCRNVQVSETETGPAAPRRP